jgi:signal transduction histidine kinase/DNA-binding LytR/AlgR family response regulator
LLLAAGSLILVIWLAMFASLHERWRETNQQANATVSNLAVAYGWQEHREVQAVEQTLRVIAAQWEADPAHFDPFRMSTRSALLADVSEQVAVIDKNGVVVASTQPKWIGTNRHDDDDFTVAAAGQGNILYVSPARTEPITGRPIIVFAQRLPDQDSKFRGVLMATIDLRQWALTLGNVDLGPNALIALIGDDGAAYRLFDDASKNAVVNINESAMLRAARSEAQANWVGPSAPDGQRRIHAFRRLSPAEPTIVVGIDYEKMLQDAAVWQREALLFGLGLTCLVIAACGLLARQVDDARDREEQVAREREKLEAAYQALAVAHAHADAKSNELSATIGGMSDGIMMLDRDLRLMQWNRNYPEIDGVPREALRVGMSMEEILRIQVRAGEFGMVDEDAEVERRLAMLSGKQHTGTIERTRPDRRTVELRRSALPGGGFVTLYTDITPRKQAQALQEQARQVAEQAAEAKSRFVAIVSHEIRTPLNAVLTALAMLSETRLMPAQQELADRAAQAGEALLHLLTDILEMSKMEAGQLVLRPEVFTLRPLLEGVQEMFRAQAAERGMAITVALAPGAPERMRGDPGRLRQILMNLVSNAVKYARPGPVSLVAETEAYADRAGLRLAVCDSGPIIAEVDKRRLFQPFVRLENAAYARGGGTGLGLAICERLAALMGGKIGLQSFAGGNEFWVSLPIEAVASSAGASTPELTPSDEILNPLAADETGLQPHRPPRTHILLVEDVAANQVLTATMLRREGHQLDIARSGAEAIAMVQRTSYDIVFMDLSMPGMSGLEATRQIRALPAPMSHLPIVAVTASVAFEDRTACLAVGMKDVLCKPLRLAALQEVLWRHVWSAPTKREAPSTPRLDVTRMNELRDSLPEGAFSALVGTCLSDLHELMPQLRQALANGPVSEIERFAHAMSGVAGMYGLLDVSARTSAIAKAARNADSVAAEAAAVGIERDLEATLSALRAFVLAQAA